MRTLFAGLTVWVLASLAACSASTDLSPLMPPPMDQKWPTVGSCGSCTMGYALKTYYEGLDHGWSVLTPNHQFAPNYLHNQVGYQEGLGINEGERNCWIMANRGICTLADEPYTTDQITWPTVAQCQSGLNFRNDLIGGLPFGSIVGYDAVTSKPNLPAIRAALDQGKVLGMYFVYFNGFETLSSATNYVYFSNFQSGQVVYHWITIVGYDDTRTDGAGHVGALKLQNSFGATWADHGYGWIAYDALNYASMPVSNTQGKFYFLKNLPASYVPSTTARISINHPLIPGTRISVGVGDINAPAWQHTYYDFQPDYFVDLADTNHPSMSTVVDVTDAAPFWPPTAARPWWVKVEDPFADGLAGTITEFSVTQGATTLSTKTSLPVSIPDLGSAYAYIYGNRPPVFSSPQNATPNPANVGQSVAFSTAATDPDGDVLNYTWNFGDTTTLSGATVSHTYSAPGVYTVTVTAMDGGGLSVSTSKTITINAVVVAPTIVTQPASVTVLAGQTATFSVVASGSAPTYQWTRNGLAISGATSATYTTPATVLSDSGAVFAVTVKNTAGQVTSSNATLTVNPVIVAPTIVTQPASVTVIAGQTATFSVIASGSTPTYQWTRNGVAISGATSATYTTPATVLSDSGAVFAVTVKNTAGQVTSSNATLTVNPAVQPLTITTVSPLPNGKVGVRYTLQFTATGGTAPYHWSSIDPFGLGALPPPGMIFSMGGLLIGTPKTAGTYSFMVGCQDSGGKSTTATVTLTIAPALPLTVLSLKASVNVAAVGHDTVAITGTIPGAAPLLKSASQAVSVTVGGVSQTFVLDGKGHGQSTAGTLSCAFAGGKLKFSTKLKAGTFGESWGLNAGTPQKSTLALPVYVDFGGETYAADFKATCSAKSGTVSVK